MGLVCESRTYSKGVGQTYCVRAVLLSERAEVCAASTQLACACVLLLSLQVGEEVTKSLKNKK